MILSLSGLCKLNFCKLCAVHQVLVVDEIGNEQEAQALQGVGHRGPIMIGTAHGNTIHDLMKNPELGLLLGRLTDVTVGDKMAK